MAFPDIPPAMEEVPGVRLDEPDAVLQGLPRPAILLPQPDALAQGQQALPEGLRVIRLLQAGQLFLPSLSRSQVRLGHFRCLECWDNPIGEAKFWSVSRSFEARIPHKKYL